MPCPAGDASCAIAHGCLRLTADVGYAPHSHTSSPWSIYNNGLYLKTTRAQPPCLKLVSGWGVLVSEMQVVLMDVGCWEIPLYTQNVTALFLRGPQWVVVC